MKIDWSLYAILDKETLADSPVTAVAEALIKGGCGVVQYRNKVSTSDLFYREVLDVREITHRYGVPLIVNDRLDIAMAASADGVHLGQSDLPFDSARDLIQDKMLLGVSVHSIAEFEHTLSARPDYFGVGTMFASVTRPDLRVTGLQVLQQLRNRTSKPLIGIGGITSDNVDKVIHAGANGVALVSALLRASSPQDSAQLFLRKIQQVKTNV